MAEKVETGGLMSFRYGKGPRPRLSDEESKEIGDAYEKYYMRKKREKKKKIVMWVLVALVLLAILAAIFLFFR